MLKEVFILEKRKIKELPSFGYEFDDETMPGFALRTYDKDNVIFIDIIGSCTGIPGMVCWNDTTRNEEIAPYIQEEIKSGLFSKKMKEV